MNKEDFIASISLFWLVAFFCLVIVALVPELLFLPLIAVVALVAFKVIKKKREIEFKDLITEVMVLVLIIMGLAVQPLLWMAAGATFIKAVDIKEIIESL